MDFWMTLAAITGALLLAVGAAQAQTFQVIHRFNGTDGGNPHAGLTIDHAGNLYGTTEYGGTHTCFDGVGCGTVFKLSPRGSGWALSKLYDFTGGNDQSFPESRVVFGPSGSLNGTTSNGEFGAGGGPGTVFNLRPPANLCRSFTCPWTETVLFSFSYDSGTGNLPMGDLAFDAVGNIYGTTFAGGMLQNCSGGGCGVVYELSQSGRDWTENILWAFMSEQDGAFPASGVIFDRAGNLYGTTIGPQSGLGLIFELSPQGSGWTERVLYNLQGNDGEHPYAGLISDAAGNLYGATEHGGVNFGGTVFALTASGGHWDFSLLASLVQGRGSFGPLQSLVMDSAGNLYGASRTDGVNGLGSIFRLSPSHGGWIYTSLHDFAGSDGYYPNGNLVLDANGNLYGTAFGGGNTGTGCSQECGVVFEITPQERWSAARYGRTSAMDFWMTLAASGNLYGTTARGGAYGYVSSGRSLRKSSSGSGLL